MDSIVEFWVNWSNMTNDKIYLTISPICFVFSFQSYFQVKHSRALEGSKGSVQYGFIAPLYRERHQPGVAGCRTSAPPGIPANDLLCSQFPASVRSGWCLIAFMMERYRGGRLPFQVTLCDTAKLWLHLQCLYCVIYGNYQSRTVHRYLSPARLLGCSNANGWNCRRH